MHQESRIKRYDSIFLKDFFAAELKTEAPVVKAEEIPAPPPPPVFSESELVAAQTEARQQGYEQGYQDGLAETKSQQAVREQAIQESLAIIASTMQQLHDAHKSAIAREQQETNKLALTIAKKFVDISLSQDKESYLQSFIDRSVLSIMQRPAIKLHVHPELAESLQQRIEPMFSSRGFTGALSIFPDTSLDIYDIRLAWDNGAIEQNFSNAWRDIEALVQQFTLGDTSTPPAQE